MEDLSRCADFRERLESWTKTTQLQPTLLRLPKGRNIYSSGDRDRSIYLVESGYVKLFASTCEGRNCLLTIHGVGDIFGELCLASVSRAETAAALDDSRIRQINADHFLAFIIQNGLADMFISHLLTRVAEYQQTVFNLVTADAEHRLAAALQRISSKPRRNDRSDRRVESLISQQELSEMVGTTRSRIGHFLKKFRSMGLIEGGTRAFTINGNKLAAHLDAYSYECDWALPKNISKVAQK